MKRVGLVGVLFALSCQPDGGLGPGPDVPLAQLEFSAAMIEASSALRAEVTVTNANPIPAHLEYAGVCAVALLLRPGTGVPGTSATWDEHTWYNTRPGGCKWVRTPLRVEAMGAGVIHTNPVSPAAVLGDSLPPGSYDAMVRLRVLQPRDTVLLLAAGVVVIDGA